MGIAWISLISPLWIVLAYFAVFAIKAGHEKKKRDRERSRMGVVGPREMSGGLNTPRTGGGAWRPGIGGSRASTGARRANSGMRRWIADIERANVNMSWRKPGNTDMGAAGGTGAVSAAGVAGGMGAMGGTQAAGTLVNRDTLEARDDRGAFESRETIASVANVESCDEHGAFASRKTIESSASVESCDEHGAFASMESRSRPERGGASDNRGSASDNRGRLSSREPRGALGSGLSATLPERDGRGFLKHGVVWSVILGPPKGRRGAYASGGYTDKLKSQKLRSGIGQ